MNTDKLETNITEAQARLRNIEAKGNICHTILYGIVQGKNFFKKWGRVLQRNTGDWLPVTLL